MRQGFAERFTPCGVFGDPMAPPSTLTDVPARLDRLPWSRFHRLVVTALGITWILDGLEVTLAGSVAAALQTSPRLHLTAEQVGLTGSAYLHRRGAGFALFRPSHRQARPQEAVQRDARRLSRGDGGDRLLVEFRKLPVLPLSHRCGHRRRIFGDQLGDPGADPRAPARPHRPRHQRQLLARRRGGGAGLGAAARSRAGRAGPRLAHRLRQRRGARPVHPLPAPLPAREPALADDPRQGRRGAQGDGRDRGARDGERPSRAAAVHADPVARRSAQADPGLRRAHPAEALSRPHRARRWC